MTDWIDNLKRSELAKDESKLEHDRIRLHNAGIIKAKAPAIWKSIEQKVQSDCEKLRRELPDKSQYHCTYEQLDASWFALCRESLEYGRRVDVKFNIEGQFIGILEFVRRGMTGKYEAAHEWEVAITVNQLDDLEFRKGSMLQTVPSLSEYLCRSVCIETDSTSG